MNEGWADEDLVSHPQLVMTIWPREQSLARGRSIGRGNLGEKKEVRSKGRRCGWKEGGLARIGFVF